MYTNGYLYLNRNTERVDTLYNCSALKSGEVTVSIAGRKSDFEQEISTKYKAEPILYLRKVRSNTFVQYIIRIFKILEVD